MLQNLISLDQKLFLLLNQAGIEKLDPLMIFLSSMWMWVPVYIILAIYLYKKYSAPGLISFGFVLVTLTFTDLSSVHLFKEVFQRLRPCHEPILMDQVRLVAEHCGGQYGFVSSHAANSFGLMFVSAGLINRKIFSILIIFWAVIISYSRIYLGVHYPGDILGGILLGIFIGWLILIAHKWTQKKIIKYAETKKT